MRFCTLKIASIILLFIFLSSCKKKSLYQTVGVLLNTEANAAIHQSVNNGILCVFDRDTHYMAQLAVGKNAQNELYTNFPVFGENRYYASAWGNIDENCTFVITGETMDQILLKPLKDYSGYTLPFQALFYGKNQFSNNRIETINIKPKTAKISITARGFNEELQNKECYFTIETSYSGFDSKGTPSQEQAILKLSAKFVSTMGFVSPQNIYLTPYPASFRENEYPVIKLWEKGTGTNADRLIASTNTSINNIPILLQEAKRTNVLIELHDSGELTVEVVITEWNEIISWIYW